MDAYATPGMSAPTFPLPPHSPHPSWLAREAVWLICRHAGAFCSWPGNPSPASCEGLVRGFSWAAHVFFSVGWRSLQWLAMKGACTPLLVQSVCSLRRWWEVCTWWHNDATWCLYIMCAMKCEWKGNPGNPPWIGKGRKNVSAELVHWTVGKADVGQSFSRMEQHLACCLSCKAGPGFCFALVECRFISLLLKLRENEMVLWVRITERSKALPNV